MYRRKIILKDEGTNNNTSKRSTNTNFGQVIADKISAMAGKNTCHTVTHVTQIYRGHCSNEGLDFILSHLLEPMWPRTVSTKDTDGRQVIVNSREEALAYFKAANYFDCRISAYPYWRPSTLSDFVSIKNTIPPNLVMVDLDLSNFNGESSIIKGTLRKTYYRINHLLSIRPSVIWSGNGYHVYIPISAVILEDIKEFANIEQVSIKFLRFAEWYLSSGKSDPAHNSTVSLNNCMLRIPGTYNSKNNAVVKIIQKWDQQNTVIRTSSIAKNIPWIDTLLQTAISNGRKYCIWRILVPYLVNRKHLSTEQSTGMIMNWLNECAQVARLDFNSGDRITYAIKHVRKYGPVHPGTIEKEHDTLYELLKVKGVL